MNIQELLAGESQYLEYKQTLPNKSESYIKTILAYANGKGGKLIIGVDDKTHAVIGVNEHERFQIMDAIANAVSDCCIPQIIPHISFQNVDGKSIIIVDIYEGAYRPYYMASLGKEKGTYIRVGAATRLADDIKIKELELEGSHQFYDEMPCIAYPLKEEALTKLCVDIQTYANRIMENQEIPKVSEQTLLNWKVLVKKDHQVMPTNAFVLLTSDYFRFAKIQCAVFKGNDRDIFIDKKEYCGCLYEQIEQAYQFVLRHINLKATIEGLVRKEEYEVPVSAIREMIVNAVCHRNYMVPSCIQVAVYDNRIEVTSPGALYGDLTLEEAIQGRSIIRNPAIAEVFNRMGIIEEWGSGLRRIVKLTHEYGLPEPEFTAFPSSFRVSIYRHGQKAEKKKPYRKADRKSRLLASTRSYLNLY